MRLKNHKKRKENTLFCNIFQFYVMQSIIYCYQMQLLINIIHKFLGSPLETGRLLFISRLFLTNVNNICCVIMNCQSQVNIKAKYLTIHCDRLTVVRELVRLTLSNRLLSLTASKFDLRTLSAFACDKPDSNNNIHIICFKSANAPGRWIYILELPLLSLFGYI